MPTTPLQSCKDRQTVTADGASVKPVIDGVQVRPGKTLADDRGELCEIYRPAWGFHPDPMVYAYMATLRPGKVKGWVVHAKQDDRLFFASGTAKIVLYDARPESPTFGLINELFLGERNRGLVLIPKGVFHAVKNIGENEVLFLNLPNRSYDHADPDKYRLPLDTDQIPYSFQEKMGG